MGFKIAQLTDLHLGYSSGRRQNKQGINLREADGYKAAHKLITQVIEAKPDVVIGGGDFFHSSQPDIRTIIFLQNELRRLWLAGIPVYALAGNHEVSDRKADIASSKVLDDPWRKIHSFIEPYKKVELTDGIFLHMSSHHLFSEQSETFKQIKPVPGSINIFTTHGSVIDPLLKMKLTTQQSPREVVVPSSLLEDNDWSYALFGHIHERGFVGSKDGGVSDSLSKKIFYNGSLIRRGFSDGSTELGRGWTLWDVSPSGEFTPTFYKVEERPQIDFAAIDGESLTSSEITEKILKNLEETRIGDEFDSATAPILRQTLLNVSPAKHSAINWREINKASAHAFSWQIKQLTPKEVETASSKVDTSESVDLLTSFDDWVKNSKTIQTTSEDLRETVIEQSRKFVELGQEAVSEI